MSEPAVTVQALYYARVQNRPITRVVIHATSPPGAPGTSSSASGMAHGTALYFRSRNAGGSAHYITDVNAEEHCVADEYIAYHAPPNTGSIGIEICGEETYTRAEWLSPEVWPAVVRAQARAREVCHRFGVPWVRLTVADLLAGHHGVCGHVDVSNAWHQSDHSDPGNGFPWDRFLADLGAQASPYPTGDDVPAPTDVVFSVICPDGGGWDLHGDGGVTAWPGTPRGVPRDYIACSNDGGKYRFDPATQNGGKGPISYPGLPVAARQGSRYFTQLLVLVA